MARFNFSSFVVRDFDLEPMSFGNVGLLIIKGFGNLKQLEHYRSVMAKKEFELPEGVRPIMISKNNFELLLREGRSFEEYFRFEENAEVDAIEQEVLDAELDDAESEQSEQTEEAPPATPAEPEAESEEQSEAEPEAE